MYVKDVIGDLLVDSHSIFNKCMNYLGLTILGRLKYVQYLSVGVLRLSIILKRCKPPVTGQIVAELIQAGGYIACYEFWKLINYELQEFI